jgi:hypothetical protein
VVNNYSINKVNIFLYKEATKVEEIKMVVNVAMKMVYHLKGTIISQISVNTVATSSEVVVDLPETGMVHQAEEVKVNYCSIHNSYMLL